MNARIPINRLPVETLIMIFKHATSDIGSEYTRANLDRNRHSQYTNHRGLLTITHICQRWREVALGTPNFWTSIDLRNIAKTNVFLERSRELPLLLRLSSVRDTVASCKQGVSYPTCFHERRIRRLEFLDVESYAKLTSCWPTCPIRPECIIIASPIVQYLNPVFYIRPLPRETGRSLQALAITPIIDWLPSNPFPKITHLYFSFKTHAHTSIRVSADDILSLIRHAPMLESLHLSSFLNAAGTPIGPPLDDEPIEPEHLRSLTMSNSSSTVTRLITSRLNLSQRPVLIRLQDIRFDSPGPSFPELVPKESHLPPTHLELAVKHSDLLLIATHQPSVPPSGLWLSGKSNGGSWGPALATLHFAVSLIHLTCLKVMVYPSPNGPDAPWIPILHCTPSLTEMDVLLAPMSEGDNSATVVLFAALTDPFAVPALQVLRVRWLCPLEHDLVFNDIADMLSLREERGAAIRTVRIQAYSESDLVALDDEEAPLRARRMAEEGGLLGSTANVEWVEPGPPLVEFKMDAMWEDEERYWKLGNSDAPRYDVPK